MACGFIHTIADVICKKVAAVITGNHFMSMLSDKSQAHKTGNEKELVLVHTEKEGVSVYHVVSSLDMSEFGKTDSIV